MGKGLSLRSGGRPGPHIGATPARRPIWSRSLRPKHATTPSSNPGLDRRNDRRVGSGIPGADVRRCAP